MSQDSGKIQEKPGRRPVSGRAITLSDLTDEILWPKLLRAGGLALRPDRICLGAAWVVVIVLAARLGEAVSGRPGWAEKWGTKLVSFGADLIDAVLSLSASGVFNTLYRALAVAPREMFFDSWLAASITFTAAVAAWALFGGAISRLAALEFSQSVMASWTSGLSFSLRKWRSSFGAIALPLLIIATIAVGLAVAGWALLNWSGVNIIGALLYGLALPAGLLAVLMLVCFAIGHVMLVPAIACEGSDAIDAMQRMLAYVAGRPLRLALYLAILVVQVAVAAAAVAAVRNLTADFTASSAGWFAGDSARLVLAPDPDAMVKVEQARQTRADVDSSVAPIQRAGSWAIARNIIRFWLSVLTVLCAGVVVSLWASGTTVLYLLMRRLNDGQDPVEVWMPGLIPGTQAPTSQPAIDAAGAGSEGDQ